MESKIYHRLLLQLIIFSCARARVCVYLTLTIIFLVYITYVLFLLQLYNTFEVLFVLTFLGIIFFSECAHVLFRLRLS